MTALSTELLDERPRVVRNILPHVDMRQQLGDIARNLSTKNSLAAAEAALDEVRDILGVRWSVWNGDTTRPCTCPEAMLYVQSRGWPSDVLNMWLDHHEPLKIPAYIRCRFEHLPFVEKMELTNSSKYISSHRQFVSLLHDAGVYTMLVVPVHLPKGQIGMLGWPGDIPADVLESLSSSLSMELLAIGHQFMRIYRNVSGYNSGPDEEHSRLTPREWDCLRILAQGYREPEAAVVLGLTKSTVRFHLNNVVKKFGCKNRTQAIALAAQLGLLGPIGP